MMFQETTQTSQEESEKEVTESVQRLGGCMEIEGVFNNTVFLRNCGSADLRDFTVYVDDNPVSVLQQNTIESRKKGNITADILSLSLVQQENFMVSFVRGIGTLDQNNESTRVRCGTKTYDILDDISGPEGWYWTYEILCDFNTSFNNITFESIDPDSATLDSAHFDAFRIRSEGYDSGEICIDTGYNSTTDLSLYVVALQGSSGFWGGGNSYCGTPGYYWVTNQTGTEGKITVQTPELPSPSAQHKIEVRSNVASDISYFSIGEPSSTVCMEDVFDIVESESGTFVWGFNLNTSCQCNIPPTSGGYCIRYNESSTTIRANVTFISSEPSGVYNLTVRFCGEVDGDDQWWVYVNGLQVDNWITSSSQPNWADRVIQNVAINQGDEIKISCDRANTATFCRSDFILYQRNCFSG
jgi:hypothetical protein